LISLLKEVGRGKRGSRDLAYEEALRAAELIMNGSATPAQIGAFLVAERIKMESTDEIRAFAAMLARYAYRHPVEGGIDCAGPYDGRTKSFMATFPAAFVLSAYGIPVTLHGSPTLPPKSGVTLYDLMREFGVRMDRDVLIAGASASGLLFIPTEDWCLPLARLRPIREELGLRTVFNTAEKLLRLSDAPYMALGIYHGTVFEKTAALLNKLGVKAGIVVQGMEGSEDLNVTKRTRTLIVREHGSELYIVDPDVLGLGVEAPDDPASSGHGGSELSAGDSAPAWTVQRQKETVLAVLRGESDESSRNAVILNGAVRLWVCGAVAAVEEGIELSRKALESGTALRQFQRWYEAVR